MSDYKTKAPPWVRDGVTFEAWHTGVLRYERRSLDGRICIGSNGGLSTYWVTVDNIPLLQPDRTAWKRFRSQQTAASAAVRQMRTIDAAKSKHPPIPDDRTSVEEKSGGPVKQNLSDSEREGKR